MTTTQTGGGNGAAPDGGSGRKLPTRAGWWWRMGNHGPYIEEVASDQNHAPFLAIGGSDVVDDGTWLAPIPGPEVCAALAEYSEAEAVMMAAPRPARRELFKGVSDAHRKLLDAITAERDGAA